MTSKIWLFGFNLFLFIPAQLCSASTPTAKDINSLALQATLVADKFMQESFELRMGYEYSGAFLNPEDKQALYRLAKNAGSKLK